MIDEANMMGEEEDRFIPDRDGHRNAGEQYGVGTLTQDGDRVLVTTEYNIPQWMIAVFAVYMLSILTLTILIVVFVGLLWKEISDIQDTVEDLLQQLSTLLTSLS